LILGGKDYLKDASGRKVFSTVHPVEFGLLNDPLSEGGAQPARNS
jgi:hypothetical protein